MTRSDLLEKAREALKAGILAWDSSFGERRTYALLKMQAAFDALDCEALERAGAADMAEGERAPSLDAVYEERNRVVAALARAGQLLGWRVGIRAHEPDPDPSWDDDWKNVVLIDLPAGQVSWHYHDSGRPLFVGLPAYTGSWDGHDTAEKYRRCAAFYRAPAAAPSPGPALQELISAPGFAEGVDRARVELDRKTEETDRAAASSGKRGPHHWGNEPGGPIECLWCGMKYVDFLERAPLCPGEPAGKHSASTTLGPSDYAKGGGLGGADRAGVSPSPSTVKGEHKLGANSAERAEPERCGVGYSEGGPTCRNAVPCKDHPGSGGPPERHRGGKGSAP